MVRLPLSIRLCFKRSGIWTHELLFLLKVANTIEFILFIRFDRFAVFIRILDLGLHFSLQFTKLKKFKECWVTARSEMRFLIECTYVCYSLVLLQTYTMNAKYLLPDPWNCSRSPYTPAATKINPPVPSRNSSMASPLMYWITNLFFILFFSSVGGWVEEGGRIIVFDRKKHFLALSVQKKISDNNKELVRGKKYRSLREISIVIFVN